MIKTSANFTFKDEATGLIFALPIEEARAIVGDAWDMNNCSLMRHMRSKCYENKLTDQATQAILDEMRRRRIGSEDLRVKLAEAYFGDTRANLLSSYCYPFANFEDMKIATSLLFFLWITDDLALCKSRAELDQVSLIYDDVKRALNGEPESNPHPGVRMGAYMRELIMRHPMGGNSAWITDWLDQYNGNIFEYLDWCILLAERRLQGIRLDDIKEYVRIRYPDAAVTPCYDLYELFSRRRLSRYARQSHDFSNLQYLSGYMVGLVNDAFSHRIEIYRDDAINVLRTLKEQFSLSMKQAAYVLDSMIQFMYDEFDRIDNKFDEDPNLEPSDRQYIFGLRSWLVSSFDWAIQCRRYHDISSLYPELRDPEHSCTRHERFRAELPFVKGAEALSSRFGT